MSILAHFRPAFASLNRSPLWFRSSSLLLVLLGAAMLLLSLLPGIDLSRYSTIFILTLLVGIVFGVSVFDLYFRLVWREQRTSNRASYAAVRKLASVFEHVLDGILILDDDGIRLEGNPAVCDILRVRRQVLLGQPFAQFYSDPQEFTQSWKASLERGCQRGHAKLRRRDGQTVYADYAVAANYMMGKVIVSVTGDDELQVLEVRPRITATGHAEPHSNYSPAIRNDVNVPIKGWMRSHSRSWFECGKIPWLGDDLLPFGFVQGRAVSGTLPPDAKLLEAKHILDRNA